jgi:hypothetical protein
MAKPAIFLLLLAAACGSQSNVVFGLTPAGVAKNGAIWPSVAFDNGVNSSFGSEITLFDASGHPTGEKRWVVILSDQSNFCNTLKANRDFFRRPATKSYRALILFLPIDKLGTFLIDRPGDEGTAAELFGTIPQAADAGPAALSAPPPVFVGVNNPLFITFIMLTNWENGASNGSFNLFMLDPNNTNAYNFSGQYQASSCDGLDGTLLP